MSSNDIAAADAVAKAKEIAAKLALTNPTNIADSSDTGGSEAGNIKRKRWASEEATTTTATPTTTNEDYNYNNINKEEEGGENGGVDIKKMKQMEDNGTTPSTAAAGAGFVLDTNANANAATVVTAGVPGQYGPSATATATGTALVGAPAVAAQFGLGYAPTTTPTETALTPGTTPGTTPAQLMEESLGVPNHLVGYIIGRGGESITRMQRQTGCRVQIQKEHEMVPGSTNRVITLSSTNQQSIADCRLIIETMIKEKQAGSAGSAAVSSSSNNPYSNNVNNNVNSNQQVVQMQVPDADVGLIIGKGGSNIKAIQMQTQSNVQIPQMADAHNPTVRTVTISSVTLDGANLAKTMIEQTLANKLANTGNMNSNEVSLEVEVPDKDVGMVIGRGGCVIKEMQNKTRCRIQIPQQCAPGHVNRLITIYGPTEGCQQVKGMIERIVMEQSSHFVMQGAHFTGHSSGSSAGGGHYGHYGGGYGGGGGGGGYGQPQQHHQQGGYQSYGDGGGGGASSQQKDYSAEWAAYYAAQAAAQQQGGGAPAPAPAPASSSSAAPAPGATPTDPTAYYNDFWRYVSYYGEEAARKYYGAWSPPVGTPNPNGNGAAPAAAEQN
uniref:K Homology domain-containing protein n=1 Tax=Leptocylindrus danicus TaxID=163516 RepID=A0A7S2L304_9STRA|mmetsp:Transcript_29949/g.43994  ORF Transcript_29949/g.43994 Transcript_29949/m.43994 type:complete len:609 (+) Transcript_29949:124-1950(+)